MFQPRRPVVTLLRWSFQDGESVTVCLMYFVGESCRTGTMHRIQSRKQRHSILRHEDTPYLLSHDLAL